MTDKIPPAIAAADLLHGVDVEALPDAERVAVAQTLATLAVADAVAALDSTIRELFAAWQTGQ